MKKAVETARAPKAIGPYSQAVEAGGLIFASGQVALDAAGNFLGGSVAEQTAQALENLAAVLAAADLGLEHVVKTTVFMTDLGKFGEMNEIYGRLFKAPYPARATVQVSALPKGAVVEIEAVAARP